MKQLLMTVLTLVAVAAQAGPVQFVGTQFDTTAVALAQGLADAQSASSPPSALPLTSEAVATGTTDVATAGAFGSLGLLSTSADVTGISGLTSGVGTSHFSGMFLNTGLPTSLIFDFESLDFASGTGLAGATLFILLVSNGTTLIDEVLTASTALTFQTLLPAGTTGVLDLLLVSEAQGGDGGFGGASNTALVQFVALVPLPPTYLLLLVALFAMIAVQRRVRGARHA